MNKKTDTNVQIDTLCRLVDKIRDRHAMYHIQNIPFYLHEVEPLQGSGIQLPDQILIQDRDFKTTNEQKFT